MRLPLQQPTISRSEQHIQVHSEVGNIKILPGMDIAFLISEITIKGATDAPRDAKTGPLNSHPHVLCLPCIYFGDFEHSTRSSTLPRGYRILEKSDHDGLVQSAGSVERRIFRVTTQAQRFWGASPRFALHRRQIVSSMQHILQPRVL